MHQGASAKARADAASATAGPASAAAPRSATVAATDAAWSGSGAILSCFKAAASDVVPVFLKPTPKTLKPTSYLALLCATTQLSQDTLVDVFLRQKTSGGIVPSSRSPSA